MAGHNKWSQIKHRKEAADKGKSRIFSKLSNLISIAAKGEPNPDFNPTLRSHIERARKESMPQENIQRAIKRASESKEMEEFLIEAYGPEGSGIIIEGLTDKKARSLNEIKIILGEHGAKLGNPGSLTWSFDKTDEGYTAKFAQEVSPEAHETMRGLIEELEEREDVSEVYTNLKLKIQN